MKFALLALAVFATAVFADVTSQCDPYKFVLCQNKFANALGIDQSYNWQRPFDLAVQIQNIYVQGTVAAPQTKGIVSVCNAYNYFIQCLNDAAFTAAECFDPQFLITADSSPDQAYAYASLMAMQQFQCSAGFYPAIDNWTCMRNVYQNQNTTLTGAMQTFLTSAANDVANVCKYMKDGVVTWSSAFGMCRDELRYYGCESFRVYGTTEYPYCREQCLVVGM